MLEHQGIPTPPNTIPAPDILADKLERVREQGYAYDHEETMVGLYCVATPIYGSGSSAIAAVSLSVPDYRFQPGKSKYTAAILDPARRISENAGSTLGEYPSYEEEQAAGDKRAKTG